MRCLIIEESAGGASLWDKPIRIFDGVRVVAIAEGVRLRDSGRVLHIEKLQTLGLGMRQAQAVRRLALLEIAALALERTPELAFITMSLYYRAPGENDGVSLAADRAVFLRSIRAEQIKVHTNIEEPEKQAYVVEAVWARSESTTELFLRCLDLERTAYQKDAQVFTFARAAISLIRRTAHRVVEINGVRKNKAANKCKEEVNTR